MNRNNMTHFEKWKIIKDDLQSEDRFLTQDMFQAEYKFSKYETVFTIDVGWYGEHSKKNGKFILYVIKDYKWDNPILKLSSTSATIITDMVKKMMLFIESL